MLQGYEYFGFGLVLGWYSAMGLSAYVILHMPDDTGPKNILNMIYNLMMAFAIIIFIIIIKKAFPIY